MYVPTGPTVPAAIGLATVEGWSHNSLMLIWTGAVTQITQNC